jgi:hypothetical protein
MRARWCIAASALALWGSAVLAATAQITDDPALVRALITVRGGRLRSAGVTATDTAPADGRARLRLHLAAAHAPAAPTAAHGVRVRIARSTGGFTIYISVAARRFKYLGYRVLHRPERLVVELWKSAPPSPQAHARQGRGGCLTLRQVLAPPGRITASGRENGLFEHSFSLVVRRADGRVAARRAVVAAQGRWSARIGYTSARREAGTVEAVARSPKDGALACLAQARVVLATAEAAP